MLDSDPTGLAAGVDGQVWFTEPRANRVSASTPNGTVTYHSLPAGTGPSQIVLGADERMWFTTMDNRIGAIAASGSVDLYRLPGEAPASSLTRGRDGCVWFTRARAGMVGRIDVRGAVEEVRLPSHGSLPQGIAVSADGDLWVVESGVDKVARVSLGGMVTELALPLLSRPMALAIDGQARLWISARGSITCLQEDGRLRAFAIPPQGSALSGRAPRPAVDTPPAIRVAPDGTLWFTLPRANALGSLSPHGIYRQLPMPLAASSPVDLALVPSCVATGEAELWFTLRNAGCLARMLLRVSDARAQNE